MDVDRKYFLVEFVEVPAALDAMPAFRAVVVAASTRAGALAGFLQREVLGGTEAAWGRPARGVHRVEAHCYLDADRNMLVVEERGAAVAGPFATLAAAEAAAAGLRYERAVATEEATLRAVARVVGQA